MTIIKSVSRRNIIQGMGGLLGASMLPGCLTEEEVAAQENEAIGCYYNGRASHATSPRGALGGIEHVVVLMMENRSFDHYFGAMSIPQGREDDFGNDMGGEGRSAVKGLKGDEFNYDLDGNKVRVFHQQKTLLGDIAHEWDDMHAHYDWDGSGKNDGFVRNHQADMRKTGEASYCATAKYFGKNVGCPQHFDPMGFYTRAELPVMYALADNYTLCDAWHCSALAPTWPNRFYLHLGTAGGQKANKPVLGKRSIWEKMHDQCLPVVNYYCDLPWVHTIGEGKIIGAEKGDGEFGGVLEPFHKSQPGWGSFYADVKNDKLPAFALIDPGYSSGYDDHPPADVKMGQAFISYIYRILASNPEVWKKTLFVITYDEHGSFYDHVVPPGNVPGSPQSFDESPDFRHLGIRVPALVIGPHVKKGYVSHKQYDHCSVARTLTDRFDLTANGSGWMNERVKRTNGLEDCIDPGVAQSGNVPKPADIPVLEFSESELMDWVEQPFPDGQEGLARMVERGQIPQEQDLRGYRREQMLEFLEIGEEIGSLRLTR